MSNATKRLLAFGLTAFGIGAIVLGVILDTNLLVVPGIPLMLLGIDMALHVQQRFAKQEEGN
jgi:small neutral amino acid transporter SnatA (MarC family)